MCSGNGMSHPSADRHESLTAGLNWAFGRLPMTQSRGLQQAIDGKVGAEQGGAPELEEMVAVRNAMVQAPDLRQPLDLGQQLLDSSGLANDVGQAMVELLQVPHLLRILLVFDEPPVDLCIFSGCCTDRPCVAGSQHGQDTLSLASGTLVLKCSSAES